MWRSRWAAIGAAVAVTLGGGTGLLTVAAAGEPSVLVNVTPTRVLDTRIDIGLTGPNTTGVGRTLDVTGTIPVVQADGTVGSTLLVPDNATAIVANLTAVAPTAAGFVSIRPGDATGTPTTSNINLASAGGAVPNSITVPIHTDGTVNLYYLGVTPGSTTHLLLDIVGYYQPGGAGTPGPAGPQGPAGPAGAPGVDPAQLVWVAKTGGDFTTLTAAMASITDATANKPYVIKIAPGVYDEAAGIVAKPFVNIEGAGPDATTVSCVCNGPNGTATIRASGTGGTTISGLTIVNTVSAEANLAGLTIQSSGSDAVTLDNVDVQLVSSATSAFVQMGIQIANATVVGSDIRASATGATVVGVFSQTADVTVDRLDVNVTGTRSATGYDNRSSGSHVLRNVDVDVVINPATGVTGIRVGLFLAANTDVEVLTARIAGDPTAQAIVVDAAVTISDAAVVSSGSGVDVQGAGSAVITESSVTATPSVRDLSTGTVRVANTQLDGATAGFVTCFNVYTSSFTPHTCV